MEALAFLCVIVVVALYWHIWSDSGSKNIHIANENRPAPEKPTAEITVRIVDPATNQSITSTSTERATKLPPIQLRYLHTDGVVRETIVNLYRSKASIDCFDAFSYLENTRRSYWFISVESAIDTVLSMVQTPL